MILKQQKIFIAANSNVDESKVIGSKRQNKKAKKTETIIMEGKSATVAAPKLTARKESMKL